MNSRKRTYSITAIFILTIICSIMFSAAKTENSTPTIGSWWPPRNFVDPVTLKITEFKLQGLSDEQITAELAKFGMGWYPKTGATWIGRALTPEEVAKMPERVPSKSPCDEKAVNNGDSILELQGSTSCMRTYSESWCGVACYMVSGSMDVAQDETEVSYVTTQLGYLGYGEWTEVLLAHFLGSPISWYTYDHDEEGLVLYKEKDTSINSVDCYVILLDGNQDEDGWNYDIWINWNWVRSGHLPELYNLAGYQKEIYSADGTFTDDESAAVFMYTYLHDQSGWPYWDDDVSTWWSDTTILHEFHALYTSYYWITWAENY